jgi:predicted AAA+ superfamily ATPase
MKLKEINESDFFSIDRVIKEIEVKLGKKIGMDSCLFLDEIQAQPLVLNRLRYFYEDMPGLKVIAAGSLMEVVLNNENFSIPVGRVVYHELGPMTFTEFLLAKKENIFLDQLHNANISNPLLEAAFQKGIELLKEYYFVGGMPEAVKVYCDGGSFEEVKAIHESIIQTYRDDIPIYTKSGQSSNVNDLFEYTAAHLGEKVIFSDVSNTHSSRVKKAINLLSKAGVILKTTFNNCNGLPLKAGEDDKICKLYFLDIGLYNAMMGIRWSDIFQLNPEDLIIKGKMAEQFIAQHLKYLPPQSPNSGLYYWLSEKRKGAAEVDFIIAFNNRILPVEIKSGKTGKMKSLWQYIAKKNADYSIRMDLAYRKSYTSEVSHKILLKGQMVDAQSVLLALPLFLIEYLSKFLEEMISIHK